MSWSSEQFIDRGGCERFPNLDRGHGPNRDLYTDYDEPEPEALPVLRLDEIGDIDLLIESEGCK